MRRAALAVVTIALLSLCSGNREPSKGVAGLPSTAPAERREREVAAVPPPPLAHPASLVAMKMSGTMSAPQDYAFGAGSPHNTEEYGRFDENPFLRPDDAPLSTFSVDVDRASYANVRRFLRERRQPPRDAVRIEEMVNYFTYDYPEPAGEPFSITTELAACPWSPGHRLMLIGLQARRLDVRDLPPNNLIFLLDTSGSMMSPDKLPLVKAGLSLLVGQLRREDRVAIVTYAGSAGLVLPSTSGAQKGAILEAIQSLEAGGSTAGAQGIELAYDVALENFLPRGNNRVILATDGDFNVGVSSDTELERLIEEKRRHGVFLTVLGFGTGNVKDSKMELLADKGNGNYSYIDSLAEARKTLVHEMGATLFTVAKDVKVQVEFNPAHVGAYRLIGYENRLLQSQDFNDDRKDAGELGAGHAVTALYEIIPPGQPLPGATVDPLKYQSSAPRSASGELATVKLRYKDPTGDTSRLLTRVVASTPAALMSDNLKLAAGVAAFGMILRDSPNKGSATLASVEELVGSIRGEKHDLLTLIAQAGAL